MRVFISHSRSDADTARSLKQALTDHDLDVWLAGDELRPGDRWAEKIGEAISNASAIVLLIGQDPGHWARNEWSLALRASWDDQRNPTLVPVILPDSDPPAFVRDRPFLRVTDTADNWDRVVRWLKDPPEYDGSMSEASREQLTRRLESIKELAATLPDEPLHTP